MVTLTPPTRWKRLCASMIAALVISMAISLGHHFFNRFLNQKRVEVFRLSQATVRIISTAMAIIASKLFVYVIEVGSSQVSWRYSTESRPRSLPPRKLDWILAPPTPLKLVSSFTIRSSGLGRVILDISVILSLWMSLSPTIVLPSLGINIIPEHTRTNCSVRTVDLSTSSSLAQSVNASGGISPGTSAAFQRIATYALISGTNQLAYYPCGTNCSYNLTFDAPSVICNEGNAQSTSTSLWNATRSPSEVGGQSVLHIEWYPMSMFSSSVPILPPKALDCVATNASYLAQVSQSQPRAQINNGSIMAQPQLINFMLTTITHGVQGPASEILSTALIDLVFGMLEGTLVNPRNRSTAVASSQSQVFLWSAAVDDRSGEYRSFDNGTVLNNAVTKLMHDTVLNIASIGVSKSDVPCDKTTQTIIYVYDETNLLVVYGIGWGAAVAWTLLGFYYGVKNHGFYDLACTTILDNGPQLSEKLKVNVNQDVESR